MGVHNNMWKTNPDAPTPPESDTNDGIQDERSGSCCLWRPSCFGIGSNCSLTPTFPYESVVWWEHMRTPDNNKGQWWIRPWKKIREWSEMVAGPRWKTFLRRFHKSKHAAGTFQYDPLSYALNFDDGEGKMEEEHHAYLDFSARFVSIPASARTSMDFDSGTTITFQHQHHSVSGS